MRQKNKIWAFEKQTCFRKTKFTIKRPLYSTRDSEVKDVGYNGYRCGYIK